ncbi:hypothetical protein JCM24511_08410 [Saitozyma sp. JCM 24511]|nr:hypothetical protein JCM24511_08410 [Saitozyma sp. JCM 24511]
MSFPSNGAGAGAGAGAGVSTSGTPTPSSAGPSSANVTTSNPSPSLIPASAASTSTSIKASSQEPSPPSPSPAKPEVPWAFIDCPTDTLVILISHMLNLLIQHNDQVALTPDALTRFHSRAAPGITVVDYLRRIVKYTNMEQMNGSCSNLRGGEERTVDAGAARLGSPYLSRAVERQKIPLLSLLAYIDITCQHVPSFTLSSLTVHRFLIAGVCAGSKAQCDVFCTNSHYAKVGGIKVAELNALEREFLKVTQWALCCNADLLQRYYTSLIKSHGGYTQAPPPEIPPFLAFPRSQSKPRSADSADMQGPEAGAGDADADDEVLRGGNVPEDGDLEMEQEGTEVGRGHHEVEESRARGRARRRAYRGEGGLDAAVEAEADEEMRGDSDVGSGSEDEGFPAPSTIGESSATPTPLKPVRPGVIVDVEEVMGSPRGRARRRSGEAMDVDYDIDVEGGGRSGSPASPGSPTSRASSSIPSSSRSSLRTTLGRRASVGAGVGTGVTTRRIVDDTMDGVAADATSRGSLATTAAVPTTDNGGNAHPFETETGNGNGGRLLKSLVGALRRKSASFANIGNQGGSRPVVLPADQQPLPQPPHPRGGSRPHTIVPSRPLYIGASDPRASTSASSPSVALSRTSASPVSSVSSAPAATIAPPSTSPITTHGVFAAPSASTSALVSASSTLANSQSHFASPSAPVSLPSTPYPPTPSASTVASSSSPLSTSAPSTTTTTTGGGIYSGNRTATASPTIRGIGSYSRTTTPRMPPQSPGLARPVTPRVRTRDERSVESRREERYSSAGGAGAGAGAGLVLGVGRGGFGGRGSEVGVGLG